MNERVVADSTCLIAPELIGQISKLFVLFFPSSKVSDYPFTRRMSDLDQLINNRSMVVVHTPKMDLVT